MSAINYDLTKIKAFVFDVDGVLSPSVIPLSQDGYPMRMANIKDGYAIQLAVKLGYKMAIITGGDSEAVNTRFSALGIKDIYLKASEKLQIFQSWMTENKLKPDEVIFMGDDIPDLKCMRACGLPCAPRDAAWEAREIAIYVSKYDGGYGCVRDVIEQVMKAQSKWMMEANAFGW